MLRNLTTQAAQDTVWIYDQKREVDTVVQTKNLYDDGDGDPRTFRQILHGMDIVVKNPEAGVYEDEEQGIVGGIKWGNGVDYNNAYALVFGTFALTGYQPGTPYPRQYRIMFYDTIVDSSDRINLTLAASGRPFPVARQPVNFRIYDIQSGAQLRCGFVDLSVNPTLTPKGHFSAKDRIIFYEKLANDSTLITLSLFNGSQEDTSFFNQYGRIMGAGDTLTLYTDNPFTSQIRYRFTTRGESVDHAAASGALSAIRVVPNPYVVTALWEPQNPYASGRGPRAIQFINLPQRCTIRIYALDGTLVRTLEHDAPLADGSETWDLLSRENMQVAYGVYIYQVDAADLGVNVGKIFLIK